MLLAFVVEIVQLTLTEMEFVMMLKRVVVQMLLHVTTTIQRLRTMVLVIIVLVCVRL